MKKYNYLLTTYDVFGNKTSEHHFVHEEQALNALEAHQKSVPYPEAYTLMKVEHWHDYPVRTEIVSPRPNPI